VFHVFEHVGKDEASHVGVHGSDVVVLVDVLVLVEAVLSVEDDLDVVLHVEVSHALLVEQGELILAEASGVVGNHLGVKCEREHGVPLNANVIIYIC
jgi:hypothetical protein